MTSSQACRPFLLENGIVIGVKKRMITSRSIYVLIRVNYVVFKIVLLFRGFPVLIAIVFYQMELYILDDGSIILEDLKSIKLIEDVTIVRNKGNHYLSHLTGKEVFEFLSSHEFPTRTAIYKDENKRT